MWNIIYEVVTIPRGPRQWRVPLFELGYTTIPILPIPPCRKKRQLLMVVRKKVFSERPLSCMIKEGKEA
jgi:hypothetical protein